MAAKHEQHIIDEILSYLPVYGASITAKLLDIPKITVYYYVKTHNIELPSKLEVEDFLVEHLGDEMKKLAK